MQSFHLEKRNPGKQKRGEPSWLEKHGILNRYFKEERETRWKLFYVILAVFSFFFFNLFFFLSVSYLSFPFFFFIRPYVIWRRILLQTIRLFSEIRDKLFRISNYSSFSWPFCVQSVSRRISRIIRRKKTILHGHFEWKGKIERSNRNSTTDLKAKRQKPLDTDKFPILAALNW